MTPSELAERFNEIVEAESLADRIPLAQKLREDVARILFVAFCHRSPSCGKAVDHPGACAPL